MTTLRSSYTLDIFFNELTFIRAKAYAVASEATASMAQVHASCGTKPSQQHFCAEHDAVVPKAALVKQYRFPDGTSTHLTDETIKSADVDHLGRLQVLECVPEGSVPATYFGKALFLAPEDGENGGDGYATLYDVLAETKTSALGVYYSARRDQLMLIERYGARGLLMRELFYATEMRPIEELRVPNSMSATESPASRLLWTSAVKSLRTESFDVSGYEDGYPARLLAAAQRSAGIGTAEGGEPTSEGPTSILKAARLRIANAAGSPKGAAEEKRDGASVHLLRPRAEGAEKKEEGGRGDAVGKEKKKG